MPEKTPSYQLIPNEALVIFALDDLVANQVPESLVLGGGTLREVLASSDVGANCREEAVSVATNGHELRTILKTFTLMLQVGPSLFFSQKGVNLGPLLFCDESGVLGLLYID